MALQLWWALRAGLWFCLCAREDALRCKYWRHTYSVPFGLKEKLVRSTPVSYRGANPIVLQHPCEGFGPHREPKVSVYLGKDVFVSTDAFESSLFPLSIPEEFEAKEAIVSAVAFVHTVRIAMVVNGRVYLYFKNLDRWVPSAGVTSPVSELSNTHCCYLGADSQCQEVSLTLFAYDTGHSVSNSHIFFSKDGGYTFTCIKSNTREQGVLLGVYNFISLSMTGLLISRTQQDKAGKPEAGTYFRYNSTVGSCTSNRSSATFPLLLKGSTKLWSIQSLNMRGFIILWTTDSLFISSNSGLIMEEVIVLPSNTFQSSAFPDSGFFSVTTSGSQIAVLTRDGQLFYGSIGLVTGVVHVALEDRIDFKTTGILFEEERWLTLLRPVISIFSQLYDFKKCKLNMQLEVWKAQQFCALEFLIGDFQNRIYYLDMQKNLTLNIKFVHKPEKKVIPFVTVSNPRVLAFSAHKLETEFTLDGNIRYSLKITLEQQYFSAFAEADFCDSVHDAKMSTLTVDIPDNSIGCIDADPPSALIAVSCPPTKHIRIFKNVTACEKGFFQEAKLRSNFTYTISYNMYDPLFLAREKKQQDDLQVEYNFTNLGCPLLVYYEYPWVPILELWEDGKYQHRVSADFVMFEIHGMHDYDYSLTAYEAKCFSQPQNWTSLLAEQELPDPHTAWTRRNYRSCKNRNGPELKWPSVKYQILHEDENKIIFHPRNGLHIFKAIVVDTFYSYCDLSITFSVYVHGVFPTNYRIFWTTATSFLIFLLVLTMYCLHCLSHIHAQKKKQEVNFFRSF